MSWCDGTSTRSTSGKTGQDVPSTGELADIGLVIDGGDVEDPLEGCREHHDPNANGCAKYFPAQTSALDCLSPHRLGTR